eukprot:796485_1
MARLKVNKVDNIIVMVLMISMMPHLINCRTNYYCTSNNTQTDTCIIHSPGGKDIDLRCDPIFKNCEIYCGNSGAGTCGVSNQNRGKYFRLYCPSTVGGTCNIIATSTWSLKYSKIYGGSYNDLILTKTTMVSGGHVYTPQHGGSFILNALSTNYQIPGITTYSTTHNVIINCNTAMCITTTNFNGASWGGSLNITANGISNRNIYCPTNP